MSSHDFTPGGMENEMDAHETLVRERFDTAVSGVSPDVVSMVGGGVAVGRGIRRRRRLLGAASATVASALVLGTLAAAGGLSSLFDSNGAGPAERTLTQLEPATPRGLAAAVMSHTSGVGTLIGVAGQRVPQSPGTTGLMADVGYKTASGVKVDLQVLASPDTAKLRHRGICFDEAAGKVTCTERTLPDGSAGAVLEWAPSKTGGPDSRGPSDARIVGVATLRDDQYVVVLETTIGSPSAPLGVGALQAIVTDPAVGLSTTTDLNAAGQDLPDFKSALTESSGSGSSGPATSTTTASVSPPHVVQSSGSASQR
jgi:hypothetical protein